MFFRARNGSVCIDDTDMDYVSFGKGNNALIMLPGLADGLATVKGMALTLALTYRAYARDYSVFVFSRKNDIHGHPVYSAAFFAARRTCKPADAPYIDHIHVPASSHNSDCKANGT